MLQFGIFIKELNFNLIQGIHAVVNIGPKLCFGGQMCKTKAEAAESVAAIALVSTLFITSNIETKKKL